MPSRLVTATINLTYYAHNLAELSNIVPRGTQIMAVVKANAYGHGIVPMAQTAVSSGASWLGVVSLGELKKIRSSGVQAPVLILSYLDAASAAEAIQLGAAITVADRPALVALEKIARKQAAAARVHLKVDTGMHRAGCEPDQLLDMATYTHNSPHLRLDGVFTHFAESESLDNTFTHQQVETFDALMNQLKKERMVPPLIHCANSAAIIGLSETHYSMVRPGLISYGLNPFPKTHPKHVFVSRRFKPVLSLSTQVIHVRTIEAGETVGYNRRWRAARRSTVALLPIGYGDGYRRSPHDGGRVIVSGQHVPIVGSISMDQTVVDITDVCAEVAVGDEVILLGTQGAASLSADDLAAAYQTIHYEVVTSLSDRIVRTYITS